MRVNLWVQDGWGHQEEFEKLRGDDYNHHRPQREKDHRELAHSFEIACKVANSRLPNPAGEAVRL